MRKKQRILVKVDFDQQRTEEEFPVPLHKDEPKFDDEDEDVIVLDDDDIVLDVKDDIVLLPPKTEPSNEEIKGSADKLESQVLVHVPKKKGDPPRKYSTNEERFKGISEGRRQLRAELKTMGKEIEEDWSQFPYEKKTEMKGDDAAIPSHIQVGKKKGGAPRKYSSNEEKRKARCERERRRRAEMDPEAKAEILRKRRQSDRKAKAKRRMMLSENEEMLRAQRNSEYMARQARLAKMTEEDKAELRRKQQEWRRKLTEEQKKRRRNYEYFKYQAKLAEMTKEERDKWKKKNTEYARNWRKSLMGEKKERYKEYLKRKSKEYQQTDKFKEKLLERHEKHLEYQRNRTATETPEERQTRLRKYKVNQAVRKLKKELENEGVPQEGIEEKAKQLKEKMWAEPLPPPEKISSYTTRQRKGGGGGGESAYPQFVNKRQPRRKLNQFQSGPSVNENSDSYRGSQTVDSETNCAITEIESQDDGNQVEGYHECDHDDGDYEDAIGDPPPVEVEIEACTAATPGPNITELPTTPSMNLKSSSSPSHECPHCILSFPEKCDLTAHIISEHPKKCWKCPVCKLTLLSPADLKEHFQSQHAPKIPVKTTATVTKSVESPNKVEFETMSQSQSKSANSGIFTCMKCGPLSLESETGFGTQKDLNEHVKSQHPQSYWPCRKCGLLKYSERTLRTHEIVCGVGGASRTIRMEKKVKT